VIWFRIGWVARPVVVLVVFAVVATQSWYVWADSMVDQGRAGESFGRQVIPYSVGTVDQNGTMTLFPGAADPMTLQQKDLYPGAEAQDLGTYTGVYGNNAAMSNLGAAASTNLSKEQSMTGEAYRVTKGSAVLSRPDLKNDPVFGSANNVYGNLDLIKKDFGDCTTETKFTPGELQARAPDYKYCERINDLSGTCEVAHDYKVGVVKHVSGPLNLTSCGEGCLDVWIGTVGDDYWAGSCTVYEQGIKLDVVNPDAVLSANIEYAKWDDYMQIWLNNAKVYSGPNLNFPPETPGPCELATSWEVNPNVNVTPYFKQKGNLDFKIRVSVSGKGEGYAKIRIAYDPNKVVMASDIGPTPCLNKLASGGDGFCQSSFTCEIGPATDAAGCTVIDGVKLCPSHFPAGIPAGYPALCRSGRVNTTCNFWQGPVSCWTDPQGVQHCPTNTGNVKSTCDAVESNPGCGFVSSRCVGGASGQSGTCYVNEEVWDCGSVAAIPTVVKEETYNCQGPVRCQGTECISVQSETNSDFAKAAAALQAARFMAMDANCTAAEDTSTNTSCEVFKGRKMECKKVFSGYIDCCNQSVPGVSLFDYIGFIMAVGKVDSAVMALESSNGLRGAWQTLREPVAEGWNAVTKPLTEGWNSMWNGTEVVKEGAQMGIMTQIEQELMKEVASFAQEAFGTEAANSLFVVTKSVDGAKVVGEAFDQAGVMQEGLLSLGGEIGSILSGVMTVYAIYSLVTLLIKIIWQCKKEEFELAVQKQLKNCHNVGSYCASDVGYCVEKREVYCCFNSPLSRIIQEQVRPQLGMGWGAPKDAKCEGLSPDQLQAVDWNQVDLTEWLALLSTTGHLPDASTVSSDALTRMNVFNYDGSRMSVQDRTTQRVNGLNSSDIRTKAADGLRGAVIPKN
jgi:conjugal transfer mating pair stabilization protein TraN